MSVSFRDRMLAAMARQNINRAELARRADVSYDVLTKLVTREGSSTTAENAERIMRALGIASPDVAVAATTPDVAGTADEASLVPVYDLRASAGDGFVVSEETVLCSLAFPPWYLRRITSAAPKNLAIIAVKGDSMEPTLRDDDMVLIDMTKTSLGFEGLFVIRMYDTLHVKRLAHSRAGHVLVISDNRDRYPPREHAIDDIEVVGKVLWRGGKV